MKRWNKEFDVEAMESNCFYLHLVDDVCDDNIKDCLNEDGQLRYDESHLKSMGCVLEYVELDPDDLTNEDANIVLSDNVTFEFDEDEYFPCKGVFLTTDNGYVLSYVINTRAFTLTNQMIYEEGLILIDIREGGFLDG